MSSNTMQINCDKREKHFLDLPLDHLSKTIFKYLSWNDLLRLRRVCRQINVVTKNYFKVNPERAPEVQIDETSENSFHAFIAMDIPTTKLFINNPSGTRIYNKSFKSSEKFLNEFGSKIRQLRVIKFTLCSLGKERRFLEGLTNLQHFEASCTLYGSLVDSQVKRARAAGFLLDLNPGLVLPFPRNFVSLEYIKLGNQELRAVDMMKRTGEVFWNCPKLKYACLPHCPKFLVKEDVQSHDTICGTLMRDLYLLSDYTASGTSGLYADQPKCNLECYDFELYRLDFEFQEWNIHLGRLALFQCYAASAKLFLDICVKAAESGLKLMNVNSLWFSGRWYELNQNPVPESIGIPIVSLVNLDPCMMDLDMPNIEKIWIPLTSHCVTLGNDRPEWPKLKVLDITVDDKTGYCWDVVGIGRFEEILETRSQRTVSLFNLLFRDTLRVNMTELSLQFAEEKESDFLPREYTVPKTEHIVSSCPNLKKIKLCNWQGKNSSLVKLWKGLPGLEEISLEYCKNLGNVTFVGEDVTNPAFFRLKKLKKLTLKGLDQMPKITDSLFSLVLKHMGLQVLILTSEKPVEQITKAAITALLEGPFAEGIEKFPFTDWRLAAVPEEEFREMEKQFRSYDML